MVRQSTIAMNILHGGRVTWIGAGLDPEYCWTSGLTWTWQLKENVRFQKMLKLRGIAGNRQNDSRSLMLADLTQSDKGCFICELEINWFKCFGSIWTLEIKDTQEVSQLYRDFPCFLQMLLCVSLRSPRGQLISVRPLQLWLELEICCLQVQSCLTGAALLNKAPSH